LRVGGNRLEPSLTVGLLPRYRKVVQHSTMV
jgi:hypothetical protein